MPEPFDLYRDWQQPTNPDDPLTFFQKRLIMAAFPGRVEILKARPARSWEVYPLRIQVATAERRQTVFLRKDRKIGGLELEAALLPVLSTLGLPVPRLLAGPAIDPEGEDAVPVSVISSVPGWSLLDFSWDAKGNDVYIAIHLVLKGVARLHQLTAALQQEAVASKIPTKTLMGELAEIQKRGGGWLAVKEFHQALDRLEQRLPVIERPLTFSNGDYNPGNFLFSINRQMSAEAADHSAGNPGSLDKLPHTLTGFVDFAWACFEDPHIGFAKYWTYDWFPAGMIERYLYVQNLHPQEFAPRLALRCLWTLQRELAPPTVVPKPNWYRDNLLGLLREAMAKF